MVKSVARARVGVALIGAGMIAKTHVAALSAAHSVAQLRTVVSRRPERARYLADHYEGQSPELSAALSAVAADPLISMAIIATPARVRADVIEQLAKAGKHILLEKPVARSLEEAREVVEICEPGTLLIRSPPGS